MVQRILISSFLFSTVSLAQNVSWVQANNGPYGDYISSIVKGSDAAIYASTRFGIYRTSDDGLRWKRVFSVLDVSCLAADSSGCLYAGIRWPPALYRSCDSGNSWTDTNIPYEGYGPNCIAVSSEGTVYAGKRFGLIFQSTDHGESWTRLTMELDVTIKAIAIGSSGDIFAGTLGLGVYRSTDHGLEWQPVNDGLPLFTDELAALTVSHPTNSIVVGFASGRVFHSSTNGTTWIDAGQTSNYLTCLAVNNDYILAGTSGNGIYRTSNEGASWSQFNAGLRGFDLYVSSLFAPPNGRMYVGAGSGRVLRTDGAEAWYCPESGISCPPVTAVDILNYNSIVVGTFGNVFRSTNRGETWENVSPRRDSADVAALKTLKGDRIIVGTEDGEVYLSTNSGSTWDIVGAGLPPLRVSCFSLGPEDALYASIGTYGVFRSTNFGYSWQFLGTSNLYPFARALEIPAVGTIFAATWNGIYRTTDGGTTWAQKNAGLQYQVVYSVASNRRGTLIAGTASSGPYRSTDNGENWLPSGPCGKSVYSLAYSNGMFYAATLDSGVYYSATDGITWQSIRAGLDDLNCRAIAIDSLGYVWTAVAGGGGIYRTRNPFVTSLENRETKLPTAFLLSHNYPNPFNPKTTIEFDLPQTTDVSLVVYDILGREVARLATGVREAGRHSVVFDASQLSSGLYLYRLIGDGYVQTRKMVLQK